jgi:hypothetical protein
MSRYRYDKSSFIANQFTHTMFRRDWLGFDVEDVRTRPLAQIKWWDSGPNATSYASYIWELLNTADHGLVFRVYIQNDAGYKGSTVEWDVPVGLFRPYTFNDVAVNLNDGAREWYCNGIWRDRSSSGFRVVSESAGTAWTLPALWPLWVSMDRDLDCSLNSFLRATAYHPTPQTRAAVEGYAGRLNANGVGSVV